MATAACQESSHLEVTPTSPEAAQCSWIKLSKRTSSDIVHGAAVRFDGMKIQGSD